MNEQTRIKPLEQAYYDECGTERTDKDRPNYKHWLEQRVTQLEAKNERLREYIELYHDEDFVMWCREQDALKEGER